MKEARAYVAYWSIYTDLPGRVAFRKLCWERLKDVIGRPAKLAGIEREMEYPSDKPLRELRCHAYSYLSAPSSADAIADILGRACQLGSPWQMFDLNLQPNDSQVVVEFVWYRGLYPGKELWSSYPGARTTFPVLTTILVSLRLDKGDRLRDGYTISGGGVGERPKNTREIVPDMVQARYSALWSVEVQTSTKRALMETHWPSLQVRFGRASVEMVDLEKRVGDVGPFRFKVRQDMGSVSKAQAVAVALSHAGGMKVTFPPDIPSTPTIFTCFRTERGDGAVRIFALELTKVEA